MDQPYLSWAEVDLDAIAYNIRGLKKHVGDRVLLGTVLKGDAYGHGAVEVSKTVLANGADWIIVNRSNEGVELRQAGIDAPILVLGYTLPQEAERLVRWKLKPTVSNMQQIAALSAAAGKRGGIADVHVKLDTGLGRQGVLPDEVLAFVTEVAATPHVRIEGMYTHLSVADEGAADSVAYTRRQFEIFMEARELLKRAGFEFPLYHICNTAATLTYPEMHLDMVRCGSAVEGIYPSADVARSVDLRSSMSLKSHIARVKVLPAGSAISYGRTYVTSAPTRVALVPVGFGDGYRRDLSNKGLILIHGQRAPIVGRVCMDQCIVDVTHIPDVKLHDEAVLIGRQGDDEISGDEVGRWLGTGAFDIMTGFTSRIPRVYIRGGEVVGVKDLFAGDDTD